MLYLMVCGAKSFAVSPLKRSLSVVTNVLPLSVCLICPSLGEKKRGKKTPAVWLPELQPDAVELVLAQSAHLRIPILSPAPLHELISLGSFSSTTLFCF